MAAAAAVLHIQGAECSQLQVGDSEISKCLPYSNISKVVRTEEKLLLWNIKDNLLSKMLLC